MKTAISQLTVERPRTLKQALQQLHDSLGTERLTPLAGGTDLFVYLNAGVHRGTRFLDLSALAELRGIRVTSRGATVGAMETFDHIARHPKMSGWPMLVQAARCVGAAQIQNRGTIGGNIANASPAGDSLPVLLACDAIVHTASVRGERSIPFAALQLGYRKLALESDELIVSVELPAMAAGSASLFRKVGTRAAQSISKVVFAGVLHVGRGSVIDHARLAWGSVAPTTVRADRAEAVLLGAKPSPELLLRAGESLDADISPIDDIRSDREYRRKVSGNLLGQFLRSAHAGFRSR